MCPDERSYISLSVPIRYGQIRITSSDDLKRRCNFEIKVDLKVFTAGSKCLDVIVTGRKLICWKYGVWGHFFCRKNKASGVMPPRDPNPLLVNSFLSVSPVMGMPKIGTGVVKATFVSNARPLFLEKHFPVASELAEKDKAEWLVFTKNRWKLRTEWTPFSEKPHE